MKKKWMFYNTEGYEEAPGTKDNNDDYVQDVNNCQILGEGEGENINEAFDAFIKDNPIVTDPRYCYTEVIAQEIVGDPVYGLEIPVKKK